MKELKKNAFAMILGMSCVILVYLSACKKDNIVYETTSDVNITGYLDNHPDEFSEFRKILDLTKTAAFLGAYGEYTLFAPTNSAVEAYLKEKGVSSADQIPAKDLLDLVRYHILQDTIGTTAFTDGKLPRLTMYGQFLITGTANAGGVTKITVNRQANIVKANILTGNGIIHSIDQVLKPAKFTVAQMVDADERLSIFKQLLRETHLYDSLNVLPADNTDPDSTGRWKTLIAEPDEALAAAGFPSYQALKDRYCKTGNPQNPHDSLYLFALYHILPDAKYLADIVSSTSHRTYAPFEVITTKEKNQKVLVNDDEFNGVYEPGVEIVRNQSDNSAANGVLHLAAGHFTIKVRNPVAVYYDVAEQPELKSQPAFNGGVINGITKLDAIRWESGYTINYQGNAGAGHFKGNRLQLPMAAAASTKRAHWIEFVTPMLVRGKYKIWVCYRANSRAPLLQGYFDGAPLSRILNMAEYNLKNVSDAEMEGAGFKWHTDVTSNNAIVSRYLGTVDVKTTDKHLLRFEGVGTAGGDANGTWWDMIHFIPVDQDQIWPRFHTNGTIINKP